MRMIMLVAMGLLTTTTGFAAAPVDVTLVPASLVVSAENFNGAEVTLIAVVCAGDEPLSFDLEELRYLELGEVFACGSGGRALPRLIVDYEPRKPSPSAIKPHTCQGRRIKRLVFDPDSPVEEPCIRTRVSTSVSVGKRPANRIVSSEFEAKR